MLGVSSSVREQAASLDQVNVAFGQVDRTTQENVARVEPAASASHAVWGS